MKSGKKLFALGAVLAATGILAAGCNSQVKNFAISDSAIMHLGTSVMYGRLHRGDYSVNLQINFNSDDDTLSYSIAPADFQMPGTLNLLKTVSDTVLLGTKNSKLIKLKEPNRSSNTWSTEYYVEFPAGDGFAVGAKPGDVSVIKGIITKTIKFEKGDELISPRLCETFTKDGQAIQTAAYRRGTYLKGDLWLSRRGGISHNYIRINDVDPTNVSYYCPNGGQLIRNPNL